MFTSWVRRKSLKKSTKSRFLASNIALSPVMLLSMMGLLVLIGLFVVQHSLAAKKPMPAVNSVQSR
jgi:hypothetical protein